MSRENAVMMTSDIIYGQFIFPHTNPLWMRERTNDDDDTCATSTHIVIWGLFLFSFFLSRENWVKNLWLQTFCEENGLKADDGIKTTIGSEHFVKDSHSTSMHHRWKRFVIFPWWENFCLKFKKKNLFGFNPLTLLRRPTFFLSFV